MEQRKSEQSVWSRADSFSLLGCLRSMELSLLGVMGQRPLYRGRTQANQLTLRLLLSFVFLAFIALLKREWIRVEFVFIKEKWNNGIACLFFVKVKLIDEKREWNGGKAGMKTYNQLPVNSINFVDWLKGQPRETISLIFSSKPMKRFIPLFPLLSWIKIIL